MARPVHATSLPLLLLVVVVALLAAAEVAAQGTCSSSSPCPDNSDCCSQFGYCGTNSDYCGPGCKNGPCYGTPTSPSSPGGDDTPTSPSSPGGDDTPTPPSSPGGDDTPTPPPPSGGDDGTPTPPSSPGGNGWSSFFTQSDFNSWFPYKTGLYTFQAFSDATSTYSEFGTSGSTDDQKREIAAFFGNVQQETGGLQYMSESNPPSNYCDADSTYPCVEGKSYYGRGALQISHNYNYGACGAALNLNLLANPDQVAENGNIAFKTALWFWMTNGCHNAILNKSFGTTIRKINGGKECDGAPGVDQMRNRVNYYKQFSQNLQVDPGTDLTC